MIIDTHVHIAITPVFYMPQEMVLESMDKYKIDYSLVSNGEAEEFDGDLNLIPKERQKDQVTLLKNTLEFARKNADRIGVLVWVKPYGEVVTEELVNLISENTDIILGLKVHPFCSKTAMDDPKMEPYIELARKFHFPIVVHTGGCEEAEPIHVWNVAKKYPDVNFVMVHMGLGSDNQEAIRLLATLPNLYGDTTWVPLESTIQAVKEVGSHKILFGSDNPIDGVDTYYRDPHGNSSLYQSYFHELENRIGTEAYEDIMFRNALKMFPGIPLHDVASEV